MRGQHARYACNGEAVELDFDRFHADLVEKTSLVATTSKIIKMDQYSPISMVNDQMSADGLAVSAGLLMKLHAVNIVS